MAENVEKTAAATREKVNEKVDEVKEKMKKLKDKKIAAGYIVYSHSAPEYGIFYIGSGIPDRYKDYSNRRKNWKTFINKHGEPIPNIIATGLTKRESLKMEDTLIDQYGTIKLGTGPLINIHRLKQI
jgi:hypothetical protein